jgi:hypothetical protein
MGAELKCYGGYKGRISPWRGGAGWQGEKVTVDYEIFSINHEYIKGPQEFPEATLILSSRVVSFSCGSYFNACIINRCPSLGWRETFMKSEQRLL